MSALSTGTKAIWSARTVKAAANHPDKVRSGLQALTAVAKAGVKAARPLVSRRTRKRGQRIGDTAREVWVLVKTYGPQAAQELGLVEPCRRKRTAPRVAVGIAIGAGAMYLLEPEHREKLFN